MTIPKINLASVIDPPISGEWGKTPKSLNENVNVIRTTNFTNRFKLDLSKGFAKRDISKKKVELKKLKFGDIILEKSGGSPSQPVGRVVFFDLKSGIYLTNNFTCILRANKKVNPKYLLYILFAAHQTGETRKFQNKTTGIINLQLKRYINEIKIPLPPLPVQKKIAATLDAADAYRQKTKTLIEKYDGLTQSLFLDMFGDPVRNEKGWEVKKLGDFGKWKSGGTPLRSKSEYYEDGNVPWYTSGELNSFYLSETKEKITEIALAESSAHNILIGSLLLGMYDTAALKSGITTKKSSCNQAIAFSKLNHNIVNTIYVYHYIQIGKEWLRRMQRGVRQKNLNLTMIRNMKVFYPPLPLQNKFADRVRAIEVQKKQAQATLEKAEELFQCLLQRSFQ